VYENLLTEIREGVGEIRVNRPEVRNALDSRTVRELGDALEVFAEDPQVRVLVLTGAGQESFVAGRTYAS
jgi:enoyl-CoA hydratase